MEYTTLPTSSLKQWDRNPRSISPKGLTELIRKLNNKKQYKPLLVTPDPSNDGTFIVLAGNMRLRAYRELGVTELWVIVLDFKQMDDGMWATFMDGEEQAERFQTRDDAMMDWSLSENERAGYYDMDRLANDMSAYNLIWDNYTIDSLEAMSPIETLQKFGIGDEKTEKHKKTISCPNCGRDIEI